ncbi:MAG: glycosyltransferase family 2 protein [Candidatus Nezhaarchaeota archaeon]|nr:glycosyltransferase family 2 protein [Candidatus Nezhaarchaeota archaeon]
MRLLPKVCIVMVTYNSISKLGDFFGQVLNSFKQIDYDKDRLELVIVDNASLDKTLRAIEEAKLPFRVTIIKMKKNLGLPAAYNKGALASRASDYIMFMNDDVILEANAVAELVDILESDHTIGAIQPLIVHPQGTIECGFDIGFGGFVLPSQSSYEEVMNRGMGEPFCIAGCACLIRASVFFACGMFDEAFFWGYDDVDLCWRIRKLGYKLAVTKRARVVHYGSATLGKEHPLKHYLNLRNSSLTLLKNLDVKFLILACPIRLIQTLRLLIWRLKLRDRASSIAMIKGIISSLKLSKAVLSKRAKPPRKLPPRKGFSPSVDVKMLIGLPKNKG